MKTHWFRGRMGMLALLALSAVWLQGQPSTAAPRVAIRAGRLIDVRTGKVAALQQSIAAGTYGVSASDVASKVMDFLLN